MKNRKTNFIKLGILLFGISILFWNCTQEELNQPEKITESKKLEYSVENINYEDLKTDLDFQNSLKIIESKIANKKHKHHNTFHKSTTQVSEDLSILIEQVNKVETNDSTITWTFETEHPVLEDSDFENFVVKKVNEVFYYYLISYQINSELVEDAFQNIKSYRVREEYLSLDNLNLHQKGDDFGGGGSSNNLDWIYPDDGGGGDSYTDCVSVYTEIEPCSSGGYHTLKYACQHLGGVHGVSNSPPCSDVCSGTEVVTVIDYTSCTNYSPPSGPSTGTPNTGNTGTGSNGIPTNGGGSNPTNNNTNTTVTAPLSNSDGTEVDTSTIVADLINDELGTTLTRVELKWLAENEVEAKAISNLTLTKSNAFINATIDILSGNANTTILTNPTDNQDFLNLIGNILNTKNDIIFPDFNILYNNLNEFNNLTLSDWQLISTKVLEVYNVTKFYLISSLTNLNQLSPPHQLLVAQNITFAGIFPSLKDLGINLPNSAEEWKVLFEIMKPILLEIGIEFIPLGGVYNSAIDTLNGINSGDWAAISLGVVGIIVEFTPFDQIKNLFQLVRYSKKGIKIFKLTRKFTNVIKNALDAGIKISLDGLAVIFKKDGKEIARILNNVMTFKYPGFGGDIVTNPNKTTTVIGKWSEKVDGGGTSKIIDSGLSKSGQNLGGLNALSFDNSGMTPAQEWLVNENWLNKAIDRLDIVRVISNPLNKRNIFKEGLNLNTIPDNAFIDGQTLSSYLLNLTNQQVNNLSFFGKEVRHLFQNGYTFDVITNQFKL